MSTLYRKYRPQSWKEVAGQNHIKLTLQREIETGSLAQAYLFSGSRGIGKTTLARLVAKSVNCLNRKKGESEPCNECVSCQEIAVGRSIDVIEIDAASHTGVANVREYIIDSSRFSPTKSQNKVFIIDEVHMLSTEAFNALLKTLEEPPTHVIFILATTELYKLPLTIVSRCQRFDFKKVNIDDIVKRLSLLSEEEKIKINKKILERVAYRSEGCLRDAESLLGQIFSLGAKEITEKEADLILPRSSFSETAELLKLISKNDLPASLAFLNNLVEQGLDLIRFTEDLIEFSRFVLLAKLSGDISKIGFELDENQLKTVTALANVFSTPKIIKIIETLLKQKPLLAASPIPQLPLEMALVIFCDDVSGHPPIESGNPASLKAEPSDTLLRANPVRGGGSEAIPSPKSNSGEAVSPAPSLDFIREKWQDFLKRVQDFNHSLSFILKMSEPVAVEKKTVQIGVKYTFHRDKLNEPKLRALAEKALIDVLGQEMALEAVMMKSGGSSELADSLAEAFE